MTALHRLWEDMQKKGWVPLKYVFSSFVAFLIDYILLLVLDHILPGALSMEIGALIAWFLSSAINCIMNRNWVFHSAAPWARAAAEYYSLAAVVFIIKTYVLIELFTRLFSIPLPIAKPIAEVVLFFGNYVIQKKWIFRKKKVPTVPPGTGEQS